MSGAVRVASWTACIAGIVALVALVACSTASKGRSNVGDGGACAADGECASNSCLGGLCAGSHCACNVIGECYRAGGCAAGWVCANANVLHGGTCQRDCSSGPNVCPKGYGCADDGDGKSCTFGGGGASLSVTVTGSASVEHGMPLVFHADVRGASPPVTIRWSLVDIDTDAEKMDLGAGPDISVKLTPALEVEHSGVRVQATDGAGASGNQTVSVSFGCTSAHGVACDPAIASFCCNTTCDTATATCP